ncbi:MAG: AbrB/MazE/SpoVT family DNA-binding domain-containing protein [Clostridia bacterium]|nr:AbrB/MazE/SpoVT family DNA-binding domain-containing protein [Clostridia bacterium]
MKSTGIVRPLDAVGRIVLPMEIRKKLGITERNDALEIYTEGDKIILKKYAPNCVFCGSEKDVISFKGKNICKKCRGELENGI